MKFFSLILALFLPLAAFAGNGSGNVSSVIGLGQLSSTGVPASYIPLSNPAGGAGNQAVFSIWSYAGSMTSGDFYIMYGGPNAAGGGTVGIGSAYKVSASKTAFCFNVTAFNSAASMNLWQFASTGTSFSNGASSITSGSYQAGGAGNYVNTANASSSGPLPVSGVIAFTAGQYVGIQAGASNTFYIHADCYEQ